jgi:hypothetical protein
MIRSSRKFLLMLWLLFLLTTLSAGLGQGQDVAIPETLSTLIGERLCKEQALRLQGVTIVCSQVLVQFYQMRCFQQAWSNPNAVADLIRAILASGEDGLPPEDYHLTAIEILGRQTEEPSSPVRGAIPRPMHLGSAKIYFMASEPGHPVP